MSSRDFSQGINRLDSDPKATTSDIHLTYKFNFLDIVSRARADNIKIRLSSYNLKHLRDQFYKHKRSQYGIIYSLAKSLWLLLFIILLICRTKLELAIWKDV